MTEQGMLPKEPRRIGVDVTREVRVRITRFRLDIAREKSDVSFSYGIYPSIRDEAMLRFYGCKSRGFVLLDGHGMRYIPESLAQDALPDATAKAIAKLGELIGVYEPRWEAIAVMFNEAGVCLFYIDERGYSSRTVFPPAIRLIPRAAE